MTYRLLCAGAIALLGLAKPGFSATPALLDEAIRKWTAGNEDWAFTQRVRSFAEEGKLKEELLVRYDPSQPDNRRWQLLEVDGKAPGEARRAEWEKAKNSRPRKHANKTIEEIFDLDRATLLRESDAQAVYSVALKPDVARLVQIEKLKLEVSVNKTSKAIERVTAGLSGPMRIALGLATVRELAVDVSFDADDDQVPSRMGEVQSGGAHAAMSRLGDRSEYEWTDFQRVAPYHAQ